MPRLDRKPGENFGLYRHLEFRCVHIDIYLNHGYVHSFAKDKSRCSLDKSTNLLAAATLLEARVI